MNDIKTAAQALVDKLDIALPLIENHNIRKGNLHTPIDVRSEIKALKDALKRDKAIDELVKHDQEVGLYDAPEWGEPFYGSDEIRFKIGVSILSCQCWTLTRNNFEKWDNNVYSMLKTELYRFPLGHWVYTTDRFKRAKKPGAAHPCRGGE